ncbi:MAG: T9SS type A sorting domain-containing protein [Bacteroidales bacterium]|nr:T9SS type A sorting domain-containing protein [Bacteroidales bacterium]
MKKTTFKEKMFLLSMTLFMLPFFAISQWNTNTAVNLLVSEYEAADIQTSSTNDGKLWVAFYHLNSGNYDMRAQLFDADGNKLLGTNGVLVSNKTSGSATFVFNATADHDGNFIISMQDMRSGSDYTAVAYKISQAGTHLWSTDGVILGMGLAPYPAVLSNGEVAVTWSDATSNTLELQKINTQGSLAWTTPVQIKVGTSLTTRGQIVSNLDGKFTVVYQRRGFGISTTLFAQHFNNNGTELYAPLQIGDLTTSGARYYSISSEGDTTYFGYYAAQGNRFNSYVQRINPNGTIPYGMNGSNFSTNTGSTDNYQQMTNMSQEIGSPYIWSVCSFSDPNQNNYGVYIQKFLKSTGARLLSDQAKMIYPVTSTRNTQTANLLLVGDAPMFISYDINYKIYVTKLNDSGDFVWSYNNIELSSTTATLGSPKGRFNSGFVGSDRIAAVWSENRSAFSQAFIQGISTNGVIGVEVATQNGVAAEITTSGGTLQLVSTVFPSVATQQVEWSIVAETGNANISPTGLVTASENGTVSAIATSVLDNTVLGSIQITISGQTSMTPVVQTMAATEIQLYSATLNALVNANNSVTNVTFEWGLSSTYGNTVSAVPAEVSGNTDVPVIANLMALQPGVSYHFRVVATNSFGTAYGLDQTFTTTCLMPGSIGLISGDQNVCDNSTGLVYSILPFPGATSYVWTMPEGFTITSGNNTNAVTVNISETAQNGAITVFATDGNCISETSAPLEVVVNNAPEAAVISAAGTTLTSSVAEGNQWYLEGAIVPGATGRVHVALANGNYHVVVTVNNCSSAPSNIVNVVSVSIKDNDLENSFQIFPNPNQGKFEIRLNLKNEITYSLEVFDSFGKLVSIETNLSANNLTNKSVDLTMLNSGVYWLVLKSADESVSKKVIIRK